MTGRPSRRAVVAAGAAALAATAAGCSSPWQRPVSDLRIASGEDGGLYYDFARLLVGQLAESAPWLRATAVRTRGSVDNVAALRRGDAETGMVLADTAVDAVVTGPDRPGTGHGDVPLLALAQVYQNYMQLFCRAARPVTGVEGLAGTTVCLGSRGSGAARFGARLLAVAGLVPGRDLTVVALPLASAVAALREGRIDATMFSGGVPLPSFRALAAEVDLRLVPLGDVLPPLVAAHGGVYTLATVPPGAYGDRQGVPTVSTANLLMATSALPEEAAAAVVTTMIDRAGALVPRQTRGRQLLTRRTMVETAGVPLHRGAVAAYRRAHG